MNIDHGQAHDTLRQTIVFAKGASSVRADLEYSAAFPYAVRISFPNTTWTISRETLEAAFKAPAGVADVHMSIDTQTHQLRMELCSPDGEARLYTDPTAVYRFLLAAHNLVEPGAEDMTEAVARLRH